MSKISIDRIKAFPFEAGQNVWLQNSDSRKYEEAVIREKCREPNSYMVEIPATGTVLQEKQQLHQAKAKRAEINFYRAPADCSTSRDFLKNPQYSSNQQFQVAKLPVQWMPIPQYPLRSRMEILLQELPDNPEYPEEVPKEFHPRDLHYRSDSCTDILISEREMLRYGSE